MTTKTRQRRGHTGSTFYNYKGDKHGHHKTGKPRPGPKRERFTWESPAAKLLISIGAAPRRLRR